MQDLSVEVGYVSLHSFTYYGPHVSFILGRGKTSLAEHVTFTSRPLGARVCSNRIDDAGAGKKGKISRQFEVIFCKFPQVSRLPWLRIENNHSIRSDKKRWPVTGRPVL